MALSEDARERLADIVSLQPTKNGELQERWGLESGSEVHSYLESELKEYYYRDENSLIRATPEAAELVGIDTDDDVVRVPPLQARILGVLPGPDGEPRSVVATLHALEDEDEDEDEEDGVDVDAVRSGLRSLEDKGLVEVVKKTVPTFRLAIDRGEIEIEVLEATTD
jgi:hypothetical protein